jgi:hypothetical protein
MTLPACPAEEDLWPLAVGDPVEDAVRSHTEHCSSCQDSLNRLRTEVTALREVIAAQETILQAGPAQPPWPAVIGKYFIVGILGQGGQAVVYRGLHPTLNKELVIKVGRRRVAPDQAEGSQANAATENRCLATEGQTQLVNEGKLLARLEHPHLARIYDLDFHEGKPFLVMDYVRGQTLEQHAASHRLLPAQMALLVAKVARGLAEAHRQQVVHQDIKPGNIMVDEASGEPRLIDFGLGWLRQGQDLDPGNAVGGTPAYVAPEQARGELEQIGPRSDLFALGGVLYFLLTGKAPFDAPDPFTALQKAMRCDFDRDALRKARAPRTLSAICLRALSPYPGERQASADELAGELERFGRKRSLPFLPLAGLAAGLVLVCLAVWLWVGRSPEVPGAQNLVTLHLRPFRGVERQSHDIGLRKGDKLELGCDLPRGSSARLFLLDSEGRARELAPVTITPGEKFDRLRYPAEGAVPVTGPPGNEFLLVVASRPGKGPPAAEEVIALMKEVSGLSAKDRRGWPALPGDSRLLLHRGGVAVDGGTDRSFGEAEETSISQVRNRLEPLRTKLAQRGDFFWGVVLPHE